MSVQDLFSALLYPIKWFAAQKVDELANTIAVRRAIFRELVRLRFDEYVHAGDIGDNLDVDRARGLAERVIGQLLPQFDWTEASPEDQPVRTAVAKAVMMAVVPTQVWLLLRELRQREPFDAGQQVAMVYRDGTGSTHHTTNLIAAIQGRFLFLKPFAFISSAPTSHVPAVLARLSPEVSALVDERLKGEHLELLQFEISPGPRDLLLHFGNMGGNR